MGTMIVPTTQRVLERLVYEGALLHNRIQGRRRRLLLRDVLEAGEEELRIMEVLPAILRLRPSLIADARRRLSDYPALQGVVQTLHTSQCPRTWNTIPREQLRVQEHRLSQLWQHRAARTLWRTMNLRLSGDDMQCLEQLARDRKQRSKSAIIRELIAAAAATIL